MMQLKDEFRTYDSLRREHDAQIVQIATEAGLRIAPDQWSSLLYGDSAHKSHMQSIIDKLQTPQSFGQSVQELVIALQRTGDPHNLSNLRPSLELLAALDPCPDATVPSWAECDGALEAARMTVRGLIDFVSSHGGGGRSNGRQSEQSAHGSHGIKYKTSLCRDLLRGGCPRGSNCTFAHSEEELDRYRSRHRKNSGKLRNGTGEGGSLGSQENLVVGVDAAGIAMITETDPTSFYYNPAPADGTGPIMSRGRPNYAGPPYTATHAPFRSRGHYGASAYQTPPPPPTYGAGAHLYGAPSIPPQPEYGMQAPMADYPSRPIETARLIPSLASQSLGVLQSRKQEILDQLEKIGTANNSSSSQNYSIWNGRAAAAAAAAAGTASGYGRADGLFDDDFIPFGAPLCSKYGPISRLSRIIPRSSNPIQASSAFGHSLISTPMKRTPLSSTGRDLDDWNEGQDEDDADGEQESNGDSAPPAAEPVRDFYVESERMKYELELIKQQIDELKMATREASIGCMTEGRQRLSRELHLIEENIREKERQLRLTQRKRRNVATPVHGKAPIDWDVKFFNGFNDPLVVTTTTTGDDEDTGIANGMRELELRLQHELEEQE